MRFWISDIEIMICIVCEEGFGAYAECVSEAVGINLYTQQSTPS